MIDLDIEEEDEDLDGEAYDKGLKRVQRRLKKVK